MSVQTLLHLAALNHARQELNGYREKLEAVVKMDVEKAKAELTSVVSHFEAEVKRLRDLIPPRVMAHVEEGVHPNDAVADPDKPTRAEVAATTAAK